MNIYEVVYWGSNGDGNAEDTIYLVRAADFRAAVDDVQRNASPNDHGGKVQVANAVYEIGVDLSPYAASNPCILRGPYFAFATNYGWDAWHRREDETPSKAHWEKKPISDCGSI